MKYEVSGWTYPAREILKDSGFEYDSTTKTWKGDDKNLDELKKNNYSHLWEKTRKANARIENSGNRIAAGRLDSTNPPLKVDDRSRRNNFNTAAP